MYPWDCTPKCSANIIWIYNILWCWMLRVRAIFIPIWNRKITRNERTLNWFPIDSQMVVFDAFTENMQKNMEPKEGTLGIHEFQHSKKHQPKRVLSVLYFISFRFFSPFSHKMHVQFACSLLNGSSSIVVAAVAFAVAVKVYIRICMHWMSIKCKL